MHSLGNIDSAINRRILFDLYIALWLSDCSILELGCATDSNLASLFDELRRQ